MSIILDIYLIYEALKNIFHIVPLVYKLDIVLLLASYRAASMSLYTDLKQSIKVYV